MKSYCRKGAYTFVKINGKQRYLWRAVDQDGEVVDVFLQAKRDGAAA
jgi:putative transposase